MLKYKKWHHICTKIRSKKNDTNNLYKLVNHQTRNKVQNRLLDCESDSDLTNRFANYFIEKIDKIRAKFNSIPPYKPQIRRDILRLVKFAKVMDTETHNIISRMQTKNCELDKISSKLLKGILPSVLPSLAHINKLSLDHGKFDEEWKNAIVRPLEKKQGNNTHNTNYRLVSNLTFIQKIAEKVNTSTTSRPCRVQQSHSRIPISIQTLP